MRPTYRMCECNRGDDGWCKAKGGTKRRCHSRIMMAEVETWTGKCLGLGHHHRVCVAHMHHATAKKKGLARAFTRFWDTLAGAVKGGHAQVLCGDFNMSLCVVPGELAGRGVRVGPYWSSAGTS